MGVRRAFFVAAVVAGFGQACSLGNEPGLSRDAGGGSAGEDAAPGGGGGATSSGGKGNGGTSSGGASSGGASNGGASSGGEQSGGTGGGAAGSPPSVDGGPIPDASVSDGSHDGGAVDDTAVGVLGGPCMAIAALACAGHAQNQTLVCRGGTWQDNGVCASGSHCNTEPGGFAGTCLPILPECVGKAAGTPICRGARPDLCNADSVNTDQPGESYLQCKVACLDAHCIGQSCTGLSTNCGPHGDESCCRSVGVPGGAFHQIFDDRGNTSAPATVSDFVLDRFEVTVGRFRKFVTAWVGGYRPVKGQGRHIYANEGNGLAVGPTEDAGATTFETGWDTAWAAKLVTSEAGWNANLACGVAATWTDGAGANETLPINCITWYEAYAFAIWDGAYLPTRAEWTYAAAGGALQRMLPWSSPATSLVSDCTYANYQGLAGGSDPCVGAPTRVGDSSPKGDGLFGNADLSGNVSEWVLDPYVQPPPSPCADCVAAPVTANRVTENGDFRISLSGIEVGSIDSESPDVRSPFIGFRTARH